MDKTDLLVPDLLDPNGNTMSLGTKNEVTKEASLESKEKLGQGRQGWKRGYPKWPRA